MRLRPRHLPQASAPLPPCLGHSSPWRCAALGLGSPVRQAPPESRRTFPHSAETRPLQPRVGRVPAARRVCPGAGEGGAALPQAALAAAPGGARRGGTTLACGRPLRPGPAERPPARFPAGGRGAPGDPRASVAPLSAGLSACAVGPLRAQTQRGGGGCLRRRSQRRSRAADGRGAPEELQSRRRHPVPRAGRARR